MGPIRGRDTGVVQDIDICPEGTTIPGMPTLSTETDALDLIRRNGRGIVEINLKLRRLLESAPTPSPDRDRPAAFELQADLVEGLDRAIEEARRLAGGEGLVVGLDSLRRRLLESLAAGGVHPIRTEGRFRPRCHQVVATRPGVRPAEIAAVVRRGWGRRRGAGIELLRPALVVVGEPQQQ